MGQTDLRPLLLNTSDTGGAAIATKRIHRGLRKLGVDSRMLVQEKSGDDPTIHGPESKLRTAYGLVRPHVDMLPLRLYDAEDPFAVGWLPEDVGKQIRRLDPDVVHLNWMGRGFARMGTIGDIDVPVVWRLPDMMPFTGGCHYADGCERYAESCGRCPKLGSDLPWDLSRWTHRRKRRAWEDLDLTVVCPSTWLAECARESSLFGDRRIEVIPNALDTDVYRPVDPAVGRSLFGLPAEKDLVLFGALSTVSQERKGVDLLREAMQTLAQRRDPDSIHLAVFGSSEPEDPPDYGFPTTYAGYLGDDQSLALLYSAADVMVVPSRYEGFGQTVSEALSCGTPVAAFDATGPSDIVDHRETGYLAEPYDSKDLAKGVEWIIEKSDQHTLSETARENVIDRYAQQRIAREYLEMYETVT